MHRFHQISLHQEKRSLLFAILGLGAIVHGGCRCAKVVSSGDFQPAPTSASSPTVPGEFTLAVWNIRKSKDPASLNDLETLSKVKSADLVLAQEAPSDLPNPEGLGSLFACGWRYPWPGGRYMGVRTYSRIEPEEAKSFPSRFREFWVTTPKVALATKIPLTAGQSLLAINIHGLNFERFRTAMFQSQLEELAPKIESHAGPVVLAGDFNTWNTKRHDLLRSFTEKLNLTEITAFPEGRKTGDQGSRFANRFLGIDPSLPLDRIFVRGLKANAPQVLDYDSSDHAPLLVRLRPSRVQTR